MKSVALSEESYARLERLAADSNQTPAEMVTALVNARRAISGDHLLFQLRGREFADLSDPADRYLALLAWVARDHTADFSDFISHQTSASRYLRLSSTERETVRRQHCARQIDGTQYWAVMNIDPADKNRFVRRLLEFIGCQDETVAEALHVLSLVPAESHAGQRPLSVA